MTHTAMRTKEGSLISRLLDRIEQWSRGSEIDNLPADELQRLARDVGLDAADLTRLASGEGDASRLLYARLHGLGLTMAEIEAKGVGAARDMERTCALCGDRALCAHDLEERPEATDWRRVCPNNWTFDEMERLQKVQART